jgi:outer membrane protein OmpA-like peptidoglycan-associated protein
VKLQQICSHIVSGRWAAPATMAVLVALAGCQSAPPVMQGGLNPAQIAVLREQGFKQGDDGWTFGLADKVLFDTDADALKDESRPVVEHIGHALVNVGITHLRVDGYTDSSGSDAYNLKLSHSRAAAVADLLAGTGIPPATMEIRGLGKKNPVADNSTAAGRLENRRVAIVVLVP